MAFRSETHCTEQIQEAVGLRVVSVELPRQGDKSRVGQRGPTINSSWNHMEPLPEDAALIIWNMVPDVRKANPNGLAEARALSRMAQNAGRRTPNECQEMLEAAGEPIDVEIMTTYISPGGILFRGKRDSNRFISFVYLNMDDDERIKWANLTGREQYEWFHVWDIQGRPYLRMEAETRGLAGTSLNRVVTAADLRAAIQRSPSVIDRERPNGHPVPQAQWAQVRNAVRRQIF